MKNNFFLSKSRTAFLAVLLFLLLFTNRDATCQWQLIGSFGPDEGQPVAIQTLFGDSIVLVGFQNDGVWRTTNSGVTWQQTLIPVWVSDFAFKNDSEGWLSNEAGFYSGLVYHTTDAGLTWTSALTIAGNGIYGEEVEIIYQASSGNLMLLSWDTNSPPLLLSTDEGVTWKPFGPKPSALGFWYGMEFSNDHHAIYGFPFGHNTVMVTDDNWNTWTTVPYPNDGEVWQPLAIPGTDTFVSLSEWFGDETISLDGGYTWNWLSPDTTLQVTGGPAWCNCGSVIITQGYISSGAIPGLFYTSDLGNSWTGIGGPSNYVDTRVYYSGNYIYAGSDVGDSSFAVYRYAVHHYPSIVWPGPLQTCQALDTSLHISFTNTCFGIPAMLDSATLTGSQAFSLQNLSFPFALQNEQDLSLHYAGTPGASDTTWLHLYFNQHGDRKDTILEFIGSGPQPDLVTLHAVPSVTHAIAGSNFTVNIYPNVSIQNASIDTISFILQYRNDLLNLVNSNPSAGTVTVRNGIASVPITIIANNMPLDSIQPIATLTFEPMLTDTLHTQLSLVGASANPSDPTYKTCVLSLAEDTTSFHLDLICGDSTILAGMENNLPFIVQSIVPNPASENVTIILSNAYLVSYQLLDVLGETRLAGSISSNTSMLDVSSIPSGIYYIRLSENGYVQTREIVIKR